MQVDYGKFILKQLDYSPRPSFSTSDSQLILLVENKAMVNSASRWSTQLRLVDYLLVENSGWQSHF